MATAAQRLASIDLGEDVLVFIARRRDAGDSWQVIARELYVISDGKIAVSDRTLVNWQKGQS